MTQDTGTENCSPSGLLSSGRGKGGVRKGSNLQKWARRQKNVKNQLRGGNIIESILPLLNAFFWTIYFRKRKQDNPGDPAQLSGCPIQPISLSNVFFI